MFSQIEITYNPYIPRTSILIDRKAPSTFSELNQYADIDIWKWKQRILMSLRKEVDNDFIIYFTGTQIDAQIFKYECDRFEGCLGFKYISPQDNALLQNRLIRLNQYICRENICSFDFIHIDVFFILDEGLSGLENDLRSLDVSNSFCRSNFHIVQLNPTALRRRYENKYCVYISKSPENIMKDLQEREDTPFYILQIQDYTSELLVLKNGYLKKTSPDDVIQAIFEYMLTLPLLHALRACISSFSDCHWSDIAKIASIDSVVNVSIQKTIEVGHSVPITLSFAPPTVNPPQVFFTIRDTRIATTNNVIVYGNSAGTTIIDCFKLGEMLPFFSKEIEVSNRNRIQRILMDESDVLIGVGDTYVCNINFIPDDADNYDSIEWQSTDEKIASVKAGVITAKSLGACKVICVAENVSAQCNVTVLPYLQCIDCTIPLDRNRQFTMEPMQELELEINLVPKDSIDSKLTITSSNFNVVNVINRTIIAKKCGIARISIANNSGRKTFNFSVSVKKHRSKILESLF